VFIAKPSVGCQGDGISLIKKLSDIPKLSNQEWIVQPYIDKPLLLDKKKFDLRLYVLISSVSPYICYLNEEGLARFCV
jgi:tubulin polyglutamylase TTLL11